MITASIILFVVIFLIITVYFSNTTKGFFIQNKYTLTKVECISHDKVETLKEEYIKNSTEYEDDEIKFKFNFFPIYRHNEKCKLSILSKTLEKKTVKGAIQVIDDNDIAHQENCSNIGQIIHIMHM